MQKLFAFTGARGAFQQSNTLKAKGGEVLVHCHSNINIQNTEEEGATAINFPQHSSHKTNKYILRRAALPAEYTVEVCPHNQGQWD